MAQAEPLGLQLRQLLHHSGELVERFTYTPAAFEPDDRVRGERVLLIEDTWVTGATVISAAGALLEHGAESVAVPPIARHLNKAFWRRHDYVDAMRREYQLEI